jgi:hypothetical protein
MRPPKGRHAVDSASVSIPARVVRERAGQSVPGPCLWRDGALMGQAEEVIDDEPLSWRRDLGPGARLDDPEGNVAGVGPARSLGS